MTKTFKSLNGESDITIVGNLDNVFEKIGRVAQTDATVLISGETGTGKELVARAIHNQSERSAKEFVPVHCGAIPEGLLESTLFGHVKGAYTGATREEKGVFLTANEGTIFLDEIAEMPVHSQTRLLRVLEEKEVMQVGSSKRHKIDSRVIVATNDDLREKIRKKEFRKDLYYRINVCQILLPTLKERIDDIPELVKYFFEKYLSKYNSNKAPISVKFGKSSASKDGENVVFLPNSLITKLKKYKWEGNIRELENAIEDTVIISDGLNIKGKDLLNKVTSVQCYTDDRQSNSNYFESFFPDGIFRKLDDVMEEHIRLALKLSRGIMSRAARELGISRNRLYTYAKHYHLRNKH